MHPSKMGGAGSIVSQLESLNQKIRALTKKGKNPQRRCWMRRRLELNLKEFCKKRGRVSSHQEQLNDFKMFVRGGAVRSSNDLGDSMLEGGDGTEPDFLQEKIVIMAPSTHLGIP